MQRQGADIQSKIEELDEINQSLRNRDKLKDDAIYQLSDQLVALSTRLQEIERQLNGFSKIPARYEYVPYRRHLANYRKQMKT